MKKVIEFWQKLPWYIKNVYFGVILFFAIWMTFFDKNNLFNQLSISSDLNELKEQKAFYEEEIIEVEKMKEELFSSDEKKEKFARERYLMKKPNEDIFVIVEEE